LQLALTDEQLFNELPRILAAAGPDDLTGLKKDMSNLLEIVQNSSNVTTGDMGYTLAGDEARVRRDEFTVSWKLFQEIANELMPRLSVTALNSSDSREIVASVDWALAKHTCHRGAAKRILEETLQSVVDLGRRLDVSTTQAQIAALNEILKTEVEMQAALLQHLSSANMHDGFHADVQSDQLLVQGKGAAMLALTSGIELSVKVQKHRTRRAAAALLVP
jgi:hypothetical protein